MSRDWRRVLIRLTAVTVVGWLFFITACARSPVQEDSLKDLATEFRVANQAETIEPMLSLYYLEGVDERMRTRLRAALDYELGLPIERIEFEPLSGSPEETIDFIQEGVAYGPSLKPEYRMRVLYAGEKSFNSLFTIGRTQEGQWRIVCARPKPHLSI